MLQRRDFQTFSSRVMLRKAVDMEHNREGRVKGPWLSEHPGAAESLCGEWMLQTCVKERS